MFRLLTEDDLVLIENFKKDTTNHISNKGNPHNVTAKQIGALAVEPVEWEKGVNINDLGRGYFYLDAKLEEGDWETMGLPEKYGAGWAGVYLVIKGNADYGYEAYMRDFYDDTLWYTLLEGWSTTYWNQIITDATENLGKLIGAVPLDGSEHMTGDLSISKSYPRLELENTDNGRSLAFLASDSYVQIANYFGDTNYRGIRIKPETEDAASSVVINEIVDGAHDSYKIFGEHNKPAGIYTGNGSTTTREIAIGGMNDGVRFLLIESSKGVAIVTRGIAVGINSSGTAKKIASVTVSKTMVLTIASSDELVNANGEIYNYRLV